MRSKLATGTLLTVWLAAPALRAADRKPTVESIGSQVVCLCGCVTTMSQCPHKDNSAFVCYPTWQEMKAVVQKDAAAGKDETAILQDLAIRYGVQVLAAPPAKGFNLAAWILPGIGLLAGLGAVVIIVRRWRRPGADKTPAPPAEIDAAVLAAMQDEMKRVDR